MLSIDGTCVYEPSRIAYNDGVRTGFTIGDVIRQARKRRGWNQERLGAETLRFKILGNEKPVNKATISKIEGADPYTSEFGVVWRVLAALDISFTEIEERVGSPFLEQHAAPDKTSARRRRA